MYNNNNIRGLYIYVATYFRNAYDIHIPERIHIHIHTGL